MTMMSTVRSFAIVRVGAPWACLVAGVVWAAVSVYSDSPAACATWVVAALVLAPVAGLGLCPGSCAPRSSSQPGGIPPKS